MKSKMYESSGKRYHELDQSTQLGKQTLLFRIKQVCYSPPSPAPTKTPKLVNGLINFCRQVWNLLESTRRATTRSWSATWTSGRTCTPTVCCPEDPPCSLVLVPPLSAQSACYHVRKAFPTLMFVRQYWKQQRTEKTMKCTWTVGMRTGRSLPYGGGAFHE